MFSRHLMGVLLPKMPTKRIDLYGYDDHRAAQRIDVEDSREGPEPELVIHPDNPPARNAQQGEHDDCFSQ